MAAYDFPALLSIKMYDPVAGLQHYRERKADRTITRYEPITFTLRHYLHTIVNLFKRCIQALYGVETLVACIKAEKFSLQNLRYLSPAKASEIGLKGLLKDVIPLNSIDPCLSEIKPESPLDKYRVRVKGSYRPVVNTLMRLRDNVSVYNDANTAYNPNKYTQLNIDEYLRRYREIDAPQRIVNMVKEMFVMQANWLLPNLTEQDCEKLLAGKNSQELLDFFSNLIVTKLPERADALIAVLMRKIQSDEKAKYELMEQVKNALIDKSVYLLNTEQLSKIFDVIPDRKERAKIIWGLYYRTKIDPALLHAYMEKYQTDFAPLLMTTPAAEKPNPSQIEIEAFAFRHYSSVPFSLMTTEDMRFARAWSDRAAKIVSEKVKPLFFDLGYKLHGDARFCCARTLTAEELQKYAGSVHVSLLMELQPEQCKKYLEAQEPAAIIKFIGDAEVHHWPVAEIAFKVLESKVAEGNITKQNLETAGFNRVVGVYRKKPYAELYIDRILLRLAS